MILSKKEKELSFLQKFYINHIGWRKRKYLMHKLLKNWNDCFLNKHNKYEFRNGISLEFDDKIASEHLFDEIFLGNCYYVSQIKEMKIVVDIGANIGFFTHYAIMNSPNTKVYSVEPDPRNFKILTRNIRMNNLENRINAFNNVLFSGKQRELSFFQSLHNPGWSSVYKAAGAKDGLEISVTSISMSKFLHDNGLNNVDFLKIDAEGSEYDIILNDNFIENFSINNLIIEVDRAPKDQKFTYKELLDYLNDHFKYVETTRNISESDPFPLVFCKNRY